MSDFYVFSDAFSDKMSPVSSEGKSLAFSNEFRALKRVLLNDAFVDPANPKNRIMVTSLKRGAGRSFVAYNAARSIALEQDKTVLLVNADVTSNELDLALSKNDAHPTLGLIDLLVSESVSVSDIICHTEISNFKVIPRGKEHYLANELFSGTVMVKLMREFQSRYPDRLVMFDAPPLMDVSESITLAHSVDQIVVVLEYGVTRVSEIQNLQALLPKDVKVHYLLNKVS